MGIVQGAKYIAVPICAPTLSGGKDLFCSSSLQGRHALLGDTNAQRTHTAWQIHLTRAHVYSRYEPLQY